MAHTIQTGAIAQSKQSLMLKLLHTPLLSEAISLLVSVQATQKQGLGTTFPARHVAT
jgi:hypothetical protein